MRKSRPKIAVAKFASCDGCQLTLLDAEDQLLSIVQRFEIASFAEASSTLDAGPYDVTLVEGSITTTADAARIRKLRSLSRYLITIGACATAGGIQALRNFSNHSEFMRAVYAKPEYIETLTTSTPIAAHVKVDFELRGCPIDKHQLLEVLNSVCAGHRPRTTSESVCQDCKRRGTVCVIVARGEPCLGPVTHAGCGAICPAYTRGCFGCFGPHAHANLPSLVHGMLSQGTSREDAGHLLRNINGYSEQFRKASELLLDECGADRKSS